MLVEKVEEQAKLSLDQNWSITLDKLYNVNLKELGWTFDWMKAKRHLGKCRSSTKQILISKELVISNPDFKIWDDTIQHEIAHAIEFALFRNSSHGWRWKKIAAQVGAKPERCHTGSLNHIDAKYTLVCPNCEKETAGFRKSKRQKACGVCCRKYNNGRYTSKFDLLEFQNF